MSMDVEDVEVTINPVVQEVKIKFNAPIFKRNNSIRGSKKKREMQLKATQRSTGLKVALVILNSDYPSTNHSTLHGVKDDGKWMDKMLLSYDDVEILNNVTNIHEAVVDFCARQVAKYKQVERLHFHYSGHGVENAKVEIDPQSYTVEDNRRTFVGVTPTGGCMIGCKGELYSVHDLKLELLKCIPTYLTLTLDCCRNSDRQRCKDPPKEYVILKNKKPISNEDQQRIAIIYGTSDLHPASDANTFTQELFKVYSAEKQEMPILQIVSKVNKSWKDRGILQICKLDCVEVGSNWKFYIWPNSSPVKPISEAMLDTFENNVEAGTVKNNDGYEDILKRLKTLEVTKEADEARINTLESGKEADAARINTLEIDKEADAARIKKLESEVSNINEDDDIRKRKKPKRNMRNI